MYFEKVLDYFTYKKKNIIPEIAAHLDLQLFEDTQPEVIYSIAANTFVIDVYKEKMDFIFVEEEAQLDFAYINEYLNHYYTNGDYKTLYYIFRYLILCENDNNSECLNENESLICPCLFSKAPKVVKKLIDSKNFNLFTHNENLNVEFLVYGDGNVKVDGVCVVAENGEVFVDGKRNGAMSFVYGLGCDLKFTYDFVDKF